MAWLCLNFDDDSDYDYVEYTGPLETPDNNEECEEQERQEQEQLEDWIRWMLNTCNE